MRYPEGTLHGFLSIRSQEGRIIASGDLIQSVRGDQVNSRLTFHFKDGSTDDETTVFSQRGHLRLISDHHIQKGPSFPHPIDLSIDSRNNQVTVRSTGKDGKEQVTNDHLDLPPDLVNGMVLLIIKNISPTTAETRCQCWPRHSQATAGEAGDHPARQTALFSGRFSSTRAPLRNQDRTRRSRRHGGAADRQTAAEYSRLDHWRRIADIRQRRRSVLSRWANLDHRIDQSDLDQFERLRPVG